MRPIPTFNQVEEELALSTEAVAKQLKEYEDAQAHPKKRRHSSGGAHHHVQQRRESHVSADTLLTWFQVRILLN